MEYTKIRPEFDAAAAELIRSNLKAYHLDIPGTVYFDEATDHLSRYYDHPGRAFYLLLEDGKVVGSIGYAEFDGFEQCCELQKLYLADPVKGHGLGYELIRFIEDRAREAGYRQIYLETHSNLETALHVYEKSGYRRIERPACVVHGTMNRFFLKDL